MTKQKTRSVIAALTCLAAFCLSLPANALEDTCRRWTQDESQSMRCFDCMRRVWTGREWQIVNTCRPRYFNDFAR